MITPALPVLAGYAALLALLYLALSANVVRGRGRHGVNLGSQGIAPLQRAIRAHANFAEYVPLTLLLVLVACLLGLPRWAAHALCLSLLAGRALHGWNIARTDEVIGLRILGMVLTFAALGLAAVADAVLAVRA